MMKLLPSSIELESLILFEKRKLGLNHLHFPLSFRQLTSSWQKIFTKLSLKYYLQNINQDFQFPPSLNNN